MGEVSLPKQVERIMDAIADAVLVADRDGRILFANAAAEALFGRPRSEIPGRTFGDIARRITTVDGRPFLEGQLPFVQAAEAGHPVRNAEFAVERPDGSTLIVSIDVTPLLDERGAVTGMVVLVTDITERKKAEDRLRFEALLLDNVMNSVFVVELGGRITYVNEAAYKTRGYTKEELLAMPLQKLDAPESVKLERSRIEFLLKTGSAVFEAEHIRKDGTFMPVEVHARVLEHEGRKVIVSVVQDITKRKQAESALNDQVFLLQKLMDAIPAPIFYKDAHGVYLSSNKAFEEYTGLSKEQIIGKTVHDIAPKELADIYYASDQELFQRTGTQVYESRIRYADGTEHDVIFYKATFSNPDGSLGGLVGTILDITDRKRVEEALRMSEKRLRDITSVLGEGVYVIDAEGCLTFMNPEAERLLGWTEEELLGRDIHDAIHYQTAEGTPIPAEECPVLKVTSKGGTYRTDDDVFTRKDGTIFPVSYVCTPIIEDGKVVASVTAFQDITERKQAEDLNNALNNINTAITSTLDFDEIMQRVVVQAAKGMSCDTTGITLYEDGYWVARYIYGFPPDKLGKRFTGEEVPHAVLATRTKRPVVVDDAFNDPRVNREVQRRLGVRSVMAIPLIVREDIIGVLFFNYHTTTHTFTRAQIDFANKLGSSIALALENARLFATERTIADTLQSALLTIPERIEGIEFGHLYRSATVATRVGGDFFDIFELEHDKVGVVIGDVSGKGLKAATLTALVKNAIKAYALEGYSPAVVIEKTDVVVRSASIRALFITVFFGILDLNTGRLVYCCAGHPPPVLKRRTSELSLLTANSPFVGAFANLRFINDEMKMERDDILLLYTDGVIEARRAKDILGEERLLRYIGGLAHARAKHMPQDIIGYVTEFTGGMLSDDVALLAVAMLR